MPNNEKCWACGEKSAKPLCQPCRKKRLCNHNNFGQCAKCVEKTHVAKPKVRVN